LGRRRCCLAGLLLCLVLVMRPAPIHAQDCAQNNAQSGDRLVLAFYYAWFDMLTWEKPLPDKPLQLYHSSDVYIIQQHAREAREAGIDALVQAWYGPDMTNNQTESNFRILLDQAQIQGIRAAVSVDMGGPFLQSEDAVLTALQALRDGRAQHPAYLRVDGRPVVFFWSSSPSLPGRRFARRWIPNGKCCGSPKGCSSTTSRSSTASTFTASRGRRLRRRFWCDGDLPWISGTRNTMLPAIGWRR
jgi:hypothetical protein